MFSYDDSTEETKPADYTGLKILAIVLPVFLVFIFLGDADMGLTVTIVLGLIIFAIKLRWNLRRHVWFWATPIVFRRSLAPYECSHDCLQYAVRNRRFLDRVGLAAAR